MCIKRSALWISFGVLTLAGLLVPCTSMAQATASANRPVLAVLEIEPSAGIARQVKVAGDEVSLERLTGALDAQLIDRLAAKRRFKIAARTDLETLLKDADLQQALAADPVAVFQAAGVQYGLVVRLTDYVDDSRDVMSDQGLVMARTRKVRIGLTGTVYDLASDTVLESVSAVYQDTEARQGMSGERPLDGSSDEGGVLIGAAASALADHLAQEVVDRVYPPRVLMVVGDNVMINRGRDAGVEVGEVWQLYGAQDVADPDFPGETIRVEMPMGSMTIAQVLDRQAQGTLQDNLGVAQGMIARPSKAYLGAGH